MNRTAFWKDAELRPHMGGFSLLIPEVFATWYKLVPQLKKDLLAYMPDGSELEALDWTEFYRVLSAAFIEAHKSVQYSNPAYHNLRHFVEIVEAGKELIDAYEELTGNVISDAVKQAFLFALAFHDCGHSGCTFRSQYKGPKKLFRAEEGINVSTEYVSMIEADEQAKRFGFNPAARLFISYVIASSTFGGSSPEGKRIGIDHIEPTDLFGCFTQLADVRPKTTMAATAFDDISVVVGEGPVEKRPDSVEEMLPTRGGFFDYVESRMDKVDAVAGVELTQYLGWRRDLSKTRKRIESIGTPSMEGAVNAAIFRAVFHSVKGK